DRLKLTTLFPEFLESLPRYVVVVEHAVPVLLGAAPRCAPPEMQQAVGAVSDRLQRPQSHLARTRRAQKIGLAGRPGELFDDHQPSVESAHQRQDCAS